MQDIRNSTEMSIRFAHVNSVRIRITKLRHQGYAGDPFWISCYNIPNGLTTWPAFEWSSERGGSGGGGHTEAKPSAWQRSSKISLKIVCDFFEALQLQTQLKSDEHHRVGVPAADSQVKKAACAVLANLKSGTLILYPPLNTLKKTCQWILKFIVPSRVYRATY